ncbi:hypothetical protein KPH14_010874 [Odynerus spinipes]|uniref:Uncharacterized protein n=1 Tax=Odynerus spinipes TaxID=1348599 RepID=A0AAD9RH44_9HYME|nr:hypothetical protein KPH14_010874 [Odynerus spinipes]
MLKWTVSRSLSANSSTPHGPAVTLKKAPRRPFRDLSNTPPAVGSRNRHVQHASNIQNASAKPTPVRRRRCRSHGSDLRTYFQATKGNARTGKQQSLSQELERSPKLESFYQGTPRVDADIGPLTFLPAGSKCSTALTLPTDPTLFFKSRSKSFRSNNELPQNIVNEARANLQSHVSDFFQQISMATSPEDVMEADSVPLSKSQIYLQNCDFRMDLDESKKAQYQPKLARVLKLHARCRTPYYTKVAHRQSVSPLKQGKNHRQTPLAGKLSNLAIDQDLPKFENMDNTVTEVLSRENETNFGGKTVAEILLGNVQERTKIFEDTNTVGEAIGEEEEGEEAFEDDHTYETIVEYGREGSTNDEVAMEHSDSSVSSASQLLEDPSPMAWAFSSPVSEHGEGEFTLKRQRGIRRKRQQRKEKKSIDGKRPKRRLSSSVSPKSSGRSKIQDDTLLEAINPNVKKLALETNLDSTLEDKRVFSSTDLEHKKERMDTSEKGNVWELESPKSSSTDDYYSSKSVLNSVSNTPEAPLVATVRRCLKYSPESEPLKSNCRGSIEIEYSFVTDHIKVRGEL